jgi:hypothetical protein
MQEIKFKCRYNTNKDHQDHAQFNDLKDYLKVESEVHTGPVSKVQSGRKAAPTSNVVKCFDLGEYALPMERPLS